MLFNPYLNIRDDKGKEGGKCIVTNKTNIWGLEDKWKDVVII
jgi:hypothetical protein